MKMTKTLSLLILANLFTSYVVAQDDDNFTETTETTRTTTETTNPDGRSEENIETADRGDDQIDNLGIFFQVSAPSIKSNTFDNFETDGRSYAIGLKAELVNFGIIGTTSHLYGEFANLDDDAYTHQSYSGNFAQTLDFNIGFNQLRLTPYLGALIGYGRADQEIRGANGTISYDSDFYRYGLIGGVRFLIGKFEPYLQYEVSRAAYDSDNIDYEGLADNAVLVERDGDIEFNEQIVSLGLALRF